MGGFQFDAPFDVAGVHLIGVGVWRTLPEGGSYDLRLSLECHDV
jgi:hypothetical protein